MEKSHQPYRPGETVAAIATPPGEGGVAIIRISGKEALFVAAKVFSGPVFSYASHTAHYGQVLDSGGCRVDDALLLPMLGSRSFTGEDTVEIHCHGGSLITRRVLEVVLAAGARAALPGEFAFKAFMNGKIDLVQAEAIQELIAAKNERALDAAENRLQGAFSQKVGGFQKELTEIGAILEAWVDFPEEGLEFASMEELTARLEEALHRIEKLVRTFHDGKLIHEGISLCLSGAPNVGKSSLMNALLERERAIVSHLPGTTRDILEDQMRLGGLNFRLIDTAGIRISDELIEKEGIRRTREAMEKADLILLVLDAARGLTDEEKKLIEEAAPEKTIAVWNKSDLPHGALPGLPLPHALSVSAKERVGLEALCEKIDAVIWEKGPPSKEEVVVTNVRHKEALEEAAAACRRLIEGLQTGVSPEFVAFEMRTALLELGKILGADVTEDLLSAIFSKFCIGK